MLKMDLCIEILTRLFNKIIVTIMLFTQMMPRLILLDKLLNNILVTDLFQMASLKSKLIQKKKA